MTREAPAPSDRLRDVLASEAERVVSDLRLGVTAGLAASVVREGEVVDRLTPLGDEDGESFHGRLAEVVASAGGDAVVTVMPMGSPDDDMATVVVWGEEPSGAFAVVVQPYRHTPSGVAIYPPTAAGPGQAGNRLLDPVRSVWAQKV